jgi:hypothetical protein
VSVKRFPIQLAGGNHNVVFAFDYDDLLATLRQAVETLEAWEDYEGYAPKFARETLASAKAKLDLDPMDGTRETDKDGNRV